MKRQKQLSFINRNKAGRKSLHDKAIRHVERPKFYHKRSLHITIKVRSNKADIQSKKILKALHHAIRRSRHKTLSIIHYSLEYNHVHLLVEAPNHEILHRGMQAFGISLSKAINRIKKLKGSVYKHRYHFRQISTTREMRNVLYYIFGNGIKHKRTRSILDPYNSLLAESRLHLLYPEEARKIKTDIANSDFLKRLQGELIALLVRGRAYI